MLNKDFDVLNNWMFGSLNELLNGININSELDLIKMSIGEPQLMPPEFVQEELKAFHLIGANTLQQSLYQD